MPRPALLRRRRREGNALAGYLFFDSVSRADNASLVGTPELGTWTPTIGTWGVQSNAIKCVSTVSFIGQLTTSALGATDYTVEAQFSTIANNGGLVVRYVDESNYWIVVNNAGTNYLLLRRLTGSTTTQKTFAVTPANGDIIRADNRGGVITVSINGVAQTPNSDGNVASGAAGLRTGDSTPRFKNFKVYK